MIIIIHKICLYITTTKKNVNIYYTYYWLFVNKLIVALVRQAIRKKKCKIQFISTCERHIIDSDYSETGSIQCQSTAVDSSRLCNGMNENKCLNAEKIQ